MPSRVNRPPLKFWTRSDSADLDSWVDQTGASHAAASDLPRHCRTDPPPRPRCAPATVGYRFTRSGRYGLERRNDGPVGHFNRRLLGLTALSQPSCHSLCCPHPNGLGALVYFATFDGEIIRFTDGGNDPQRASTSLTAAAVLLVFAELSLKEIDQSLDEMVRRMQSGITHQ